jgi:hypothetical protein
MALCGQTTAASLHLKSVETYIARAFGDRLPEVRAAIQMLAVSPPPDALTIVGFRL